MIHPARMRKESLVDEKSLKVGLRQGTGPPPGYRCSAAFLDLAKQEAEFLSEAQYAHALDLVRALALEEDPTRPVTVDVDRIEDFYEIRDKGGVLGKINLRMFFSLESVHGSTWIVLLCVFKKEANGATPLHMKKRARMRLRRLRSGDFGEIGRAVG